MGFGRKHRRIDAQDAPLLPLWGKDGKGGVAAPGLSASHRRFLSPPAMRTRSARTPHPAAPRLALLAKAPLPSPARGEGFFFPSGLVSA